MDWAKTPIEPILTACPRFSQGSRKPRGAGARGHTAADGVGPAHEALTAEPIRDVPVESVCWDVLPLPSVNHLWGTGGSESSQYPLPLEVPLGLLVHTEAFVQERLLAELLRRLELPDLENRLNS
jgi:hypothetical protein